MPDSIFGDKRTRSQLTLPDNVLQLHRSPLKDARTALRNHHSPGTIGGDAECEETDDEILLSPKKTKSQMASAKRSASPPPLDEYSSKDIGDSRQLKRAKRDDSTTGGGSSDAENVNSTVNHPHATHSRHFSEPNIITGKRTPYRRSATPCESTSKPKSSAEPSLPPGYKSRAQSVPLFSTSTSLPKVDFTNLPPSPTRARSRSRSPSKDWALKITFPEPRVAERKLDSIPDEEGPGEVEGDVGGEQGIPASASLPLPQISSRLVDAPPVDDVSVETLGVDADSGVPEHSEPPIQPAVEKPTVASMAPPFTPARPGMSGLLLNLSPLTPLPETPLPTKSNQATEDRYTGSMGWGVSTETTIENTFPKIAPVPDPEPSKPNLLRPGRPTKASSSMMPPPAPTLNHKSAPPVDNSATTSVASSSKALPPASTKGNQSTRANVNNFLMDAARKAKPLPNQTLKGKGKGKEKLSFSSNNIPTTTSSITTSKAQKGKGKAKEVKNEVESPKISIKAKMRPREKPTPKPILIPEPMEEEADMTSDDKIVDRAASPPTSPLTPQPMEISRPTTPAQAPPPDFAAMDISPARESTVDRDSLFDEVEAEETIAVDEKQDGAADTIPPLSETPTPTMEFPTTDTSQLTKPSTSEPDSVNADAPAPSDVNDEATEVQGKKRLPSAVTGNGRVTRSVSSKRKATDPASPTVRTTKRSISSTLPVPTIASKAKATKSGPSKVPVASKAAVAADEMPSTAGPSAVSDHDSPTKKASKADSSFARPTKASLARTPLRRSPTRAASLAFKSNSSPSPTKLSRSSTSMDVRPRLPISRTFTYGASGSGPSSLTNLENALQKLKMPPPARPNTSMGFNRDDDSDCSFEMTTKARDDTSVGRSELGLGRPGGGIKRAATVGPEEMDSGSSSRASSLLSTTMTTTTSKRSADSAGSKVTKPVQRPMSMFLTGKGPTATGTTKFPSGTGAVMRGGAAHRNMFPVVRGRSGQKASRNPGLPSVMGSPVKGGAPRDDGDEGAAASNAAMGDHSDQKGLPASAVPLDEVELSDIIFGSSDKGKGKEKAGTEETTKKIRRPSMAASMASASLTQSLSALPPKTPVEQGQGLMGPPESPPRRGGLRSSSSSYPASSSSGKSKGKGSPQSSAPPSPPATLSILKQCKVFVDVRSNEGEDAGQLFKEMLVKLGARVMTVVGQTCTHIVYKNGLNSTLTRYRALNPKPHVVRMAWVVACVESNARVDEAEHSIDLDGVNVAGTNKRRKSMIPKLIPRDYDYESSIAGPSRLDNDGDAVNGDTSMSESNTSMSVDGDLPPLEKARMRLAMPRRT